MTVNPAIGLLGKLHAWSRENRLAIAILVVAALARTIMVALRFLQIPPWPSGWPGPTPWGDSTIYLGDLGFIAKGYLPYRDFPFNYGPLYLYSMLPFYEISPALAFIPSLLADTLTAAIIYQAIKSANHGRVAIFMGLSYAVSPFILINEGYLWLSSQPVTSFAVLSVFLATKERYRESLLCLSFAVLFKQEALFLLPAIMVLDWSRRKWTAFADLGIGLGVVAAFLAPFLVLAPVSTIYSLMYGPFINLGTVEPSRLANAFQPASSLLTSQAYCNLTTIPGVFTGQFCGTIFNTQAFAQALLQGRIESLASMLEFPLFAIFCFGLISIRRSSNFLPLACSLLSIGGLLAYSRYVHPVFAYYLVPVYALLLLSARHRGESIVACIAVFLASFLPEGPFALILPLCSVFAIVALESGHKNHTK